MLNNIETICGNGFKTVFTDNFNAGEYRVEKGERLDIVFLGSDQFDNGAKGNSLKLMVNGEGAEINFFGFISGKEKARFELAVVAEHVKPGGKSTINMNAVMYDESLLDFKGNLIIEREAQLTDTYLASHSLLMNKGARAHTVPSLEVLANDVKAGHAATVGKVNEEDLFYLLSRGIDKQSAEQLLVLGFFEDLLMKIECVDLRDSLRQAIIKSLPFYNV